MKFIFFIAAFNAFFFTVLLLQKRTRALHDNILVGWLIYLGLYVGLYALKTHDLFTNFNLLSISVLSLLMLFGPFLFTYLEALVTNKHRIHFNNLLHLAPFILFNLYLGIASFSPGMTARLNMERISPEFDPPALFIFFLILTAISGPVYFLLTIKLFNRFDIRIFNNFSNTENIDLTWIRKLILVFGVVWTALIGVTVIHHVFHLFSMAFCTDGLFLSLSVFVILIGYFGLKQKIIYPNEDVKITVESDNKQGRYAGSRINYSEEEQLANQLKKHLDSSKPYLDPNLTLAQLAEQIGISSHLLSQVINQQFNLNFFDFVNQYRVDEFKRRIVNPTYENYSLLGIAFDCGFNSKSAFNRIFKKVTNLTPSQYKQSEKQSLTL
jgi:AraC-like DNA-binding protein